MKTTTTTATKLASLLRLSQKVYERDFYSHVFANPVRYISSRFLENHLTKFAGRQKAASCLGPISSKITLTKRKGENCGILDWVRQYIIQTTNNN